MKFKTDKFAIGQKVYHETFGAGVIIEKSYSRRGTENYGVKFDKGGPQGWADKASHDIADLVAVQ